MTYAAVFDLDGTLVRGTSVERLLVPYLWRRGVVGLPQAARALQLAATLPWAGRTRALRSNKRWLTDVAEADVRDCMADFLRDRVERLWRRELLVRMEELRQGGAALHLLTGAPDFVAQAVSSYLALDGAMGTRLEVRRGRFTGRLAGPHLFGAAKQKAVMELAEAAHLDLSASHGFADHPSDMAFLACFGKPVAVAPHGRLRQMAAARGWEVLEADRAPLVSRVT